MLDACGHVRRAAALCSPITVESRSSAHPVAGRTVKEAAVWKTVDSLGLLLLGAYSKSSGGGGPRSYCGSVGRAAGSGVQKHEDKLAPAGILASNQ